jgi:type III pantothenate kinase
MLIADIGNRHIHIYNGLYVEHLRVDSAIKKYADMDIAYISVNHKAEDSIKNQTRWRDISHKIVLDGSYDTMGIDRKALCLSHKDGLFVDAGSAITVDLVEGGVYQGGFILLGLSSMIDAYSEISPALSTTLNREISIDRLPITTRDGISYGIIAPIKSVIKRDQKDHRVYFTGGDGEFLSSYIEGSIFDDKLVFKGVLNSLNQMK